MERCNKKSVSRAEEASVRRIAQEREKVKGATESLSMRKVMGEKNKPKHVHPELLLPNEVSSSEGS